MTNIHSIKSALVFWGALSSMSVWVSSQERNMVKQTLFFKLSSLFQIWVIHSIKYDLMCWGKLNSMSTWISSQERKSTILLQYENMCLKKLYFTSHFPWFSEDIIFLYLCNYVGILWAWLLINTKESIDRWLK